MNKMQLHRKSKRRKTQRYGHQSKKVKDHKNKISNQRYIKKSHPRIDAHESTIYMRKLYHPSYSRTRPFWSFHRRYDEYEDLDYDYVLPIKFSSRNFYYDDLYDYEDEFSRRTYFPPKHGYGGYRHKPSSYNLIPILTLLGIIGLLMNLGLGKIIDLRTFDDSTKIYISLDPKTISTFLYYSILCIQWAKQNDIS